MTRISYEDFKKLVKMLEKESQGGILTFKEQGSTLHVSAMDREGKEMLIELSDVQYPLFPRITRTESF